MLPVTTTYTSRIPMPASSHVLEKPRWAVGRVALFWVAYLAVLLVASIPKGMAPPQLGQLVWGLLSSIALLTLTLVVVRREGRTPHDVGLYFSARSAGWLLIGGAIGIAVYGCTIEIDALVAGPITFTRGTASGSAVLLAVATFLMLSVMEELGFRGYTLRTLVARLGPWPAQIIVAIAFAFTHVLYGWSWQAILMGVLPSAFLFGAAALAFADIAAAVGLHAALNIGQWTAGAQNTPGIWNISVADSAQTRLATVGPIVAIAVIAAATSLLWWSGSRSARQR
jgi:hypothetical protein